MAVEYGITIFYCDDDFGPTVPPGTDSLLICMSCECAAFAAVMTRGVVTAVSATQDRPANFSIQHYFTCKFRAKTTPRIDTGSLLICILGKITHLIPFLPHSDRNYPLLHQHRAPFQRATWCYVAPERFSAPMN